MRQISKIADRMLGLLVPAAEAKAVSCGSCYYTGLSDQDPGCAEGYIYQVNCPCCWTEKTGCINQYSWRCP